MEDGAEPAPLEPAADDLPSRPEQPTAAADSPPQPETPIEQEEVDLARYLEPPVEEPSVRDDSQPTTELDAAGLIAALDTYDRRLKAVESYCRELCPTGDGTAAARFALNALDISSGDNEVLLMATRVLAAAALTPDAFGRPGVDRFENRPERCSSTPSLLAARANGSLSSRDHARLERHLDGCLVCRAAELRAARADRVFAAILELPLGPAHHG
jgi:hypothetical protein